MGIRYIQEFLGHEDLRTTTIYSKATLKGLRRHYNKHHPKEKRVRRASRQQTHMIGTGHNGKITNG